MAILISLAFAGGGRCADAAAVPNATATLYIFAHEDDEIFILAKMALDLRNGRDVHAIWITDGSGTAAPDVREKESRSSMKLIGMKQENLHFLGFQDRYSYKHLDEAFPRIMQIVAAVRPAQVTTNAFEGGNIDHDVASLMGTFVSEKADWSPAHYEFPLYNTYKNNYQAGKFLPQPGAVTLYTKLDADLADLKIKALDLYPSQAAIINAIKSMTNRKKVMRDGEPYRISPAYDYMKKPVEETLGYELNQRNPVTFNDWKTYVEPFLEKMREEKK